MGKTLYSKPSVLSLTKMKTSKTTRVFKDLMLLKCIRLPAAKNSFIPGVFEHSDSL